MAPRLELGLKLVSQLWIAYDVVAMVLWPFRTNWGLVRQRQEDLAPTSGQYVPITFSRIPKPMVCFGRLKGWEIQEKEDTTHVGDISLCLMIAKIMETHFTETSKSN